MVFFLVSIPLHSAVLTQPHIHQHMQHNTTHYTHRTHTTHQSDSQEECDGRGLTSITGNLRQRTRWIDCEKKCGKVCRIRKKWHRSQDSECSQAWHGTEGRRQQLRTKTEEATSIPKLRCQGTPTGIVWKQVNFGSRCGWLHGVVSFGRTGHLDCHLHKSPHAWQEAQALSKRRTSHDSFGLPGKADRQLSSKANTKVRAQSSHW